MRQDDSGRKEGGATMEENRPARPSLDAHVDAKDRNRVQTLREHSWAVSALCGREAEPLGLSAMGRLAGLLHDMGKARETFQSYLHCDHPARQAALRGTINHSAAGAQWLMERYQKDHPDARLALRLLALSLTGHHGGLSDVLTLDGRDALTPRIYPAREIDLAECASGFLENCASVEELDGLFTQAVQEAARLRQRILTASQGQEWAYACFLFGLAQRFLFSALIDADRYDSYAFAAEETPHEIPVNAAFWEALVNRLERRLAQFPCDTPINQSRKYIADQCLDQALRRPTGVYRLYAPTGGGKTLSSLRFALHHAKAWGKKRIFYVIPFTTIIEQTADELRKTLGDELYLVEHHSNLIPEEGESPQELAQRELFTERWSAPIILTTMVQFLNTLFSGRTGCARRMQGLADAVILFDEIQAIPAQCIHLFNAACAFLSRLCGATIVLCTATQPELSQTQVPLWADAELIPDRQQLFLSLRRTRMVDRRDAGAMEMEQLAQFAWQRMEQDGHASLLVILNTRRNARELYDALKGLLPEDVHLVHLSANLCGAHRSHVIDGIRARLEGKRRVLCVSTQLVEAGVDLSFSCVIRALAGLENLAQAAGRCNRHAEDPRPHDVFLVQIKNEKLSRLPEIEQGQKNCQPALYMAAKKGIDPLSPEAVKFYYNVRFRDQQEQERMSYILYRNDTNIPESTTLYSLLGFNGTGRNAAQNNRLAVPYDDPLNQAFATAGEVFEPIHSPTTAVLAPYQQGKQIIESLAAEPNVKQTRRLLQLAQRYTVGLYRNDLQALLANEALFTLPCGALALYEGYYDGETGVTLERQPMEPLLL